MVPTNYYLLLLLLQREGMNEAFAAVVYCQFFLPLQVWLRMEPGIIIGAVPHEAGS